MSEVKVLDEDGDELGTFDVTPGSSVFLDNGKVKASVTAREEED